MTPLDARRYPGPQPFATREAHIFKGRSLDVERLRLTLLRLRQVMVFAKSGLGKSSLINAGLQPLLEQDGWRQIVKVRIYPHYKGAKTPLERTWDALAEAGIHPKPSYLDRIIPEAASNLWARLKAHQEENARPVLLIVDQMEELFTHPPESVTAWQSAMAEALSENVPDPVVDALRKLEEQNPDILTEDEQRLLFTPKPPHLICAIREDALHHALGLRAALPELVQNLFELKPLTRSQAEEAIREPALSTDSFSTPNFRITPEAMKSVLDFLGKRPDTTVLQIICQDLERRAASEGKSEIDNGDLPVFKDIVKNFYLDKVNSAPGGDPLIIRRFIEGRLIYQGRRSPMPKRDCIDLIGEEALIYLVNEHLLRCEQLEREDESGEAYSFYELSHDSLVGPVAELKSEREKKEREAANRAEALRLRAEEEEKRRQREEKIRTEIQERKRLEEQVAKEKERAAELLKARDQERLAREREQNRTLELQASEAKLSKGMRRLKLITIVAITAILAAFFLVLKIVDSFKSAQKQAEETAADKARIESLEKAYEGFTENLVFFEDSLAHVGKTFIDSLGRPLQLKRKVYDLAPFESGGFAVGYSEWDKTRPLIVDTEGEIYDAALSPSSVSESTEALYFPQGNLLGAFGCLAKCKNLKFLNLSRLDAHCDYGSLDINDKNFSLPWDSISPHRELRILDLSFHKQANLPDGFTKLRELRRLNLSHNLIRSLPSEIAELKKLLNLDLSSNILDSLPSSIGNLKQLRSLNVSNNLIRSLPQSIANLASLQKLNAASNAFEGFPKDILKLKKLQQLVLSNCSIESIPIEISSLVNLTELNLTGNQLKDNIILSGNKALRRLYLRDCNLGVIQVRIDSLSNLEFLDLSQNDSLRMPQNFLCFPNLKVLNLDQNSLTSLDAPICNLQKLETLTLTYNRFQAVPSQVLNLSNLRRLFLQNNNINELPDAFKRLGKLEVLGISQKCWDNSHKLIRSMPSLQLVFVDHRPVRIR